MTRSSVFWVGLIVCGLIAGLRIGYAEEPLSGQELKAGLLLLKAQEHDAQGRWEEAAAAYEAVIELTPDLFEPYYMLALYHIGTAEGQRYFEQAIERHPRIAAPYYWHAYVDYKNGFPEKARPYLNEFLEVAQLDPAETGGSRVKTAKELLVALDRGLPFPYPETEQ